MDRKLALWRSPLIAIFILATGFVVPAAISGMEAAAHKIDLLIRGPRGGFIGDNIQERGAFREKIILRNWRKRTTKFWVRVQNEGTVTDKARLISTRGDRDIGICWYFRGKKLTTGKRRLRYVTPDMEPGDSLTFMVKIKVRRTLSDRREVTILTSGQSDGNRDGSTTDRVLGKLLIPPSR